MALFSFVALKTLFLIIIWISMGLCTEIFGPTLKDLAIRFNTDYEAVSRAVSARGIGGCIGGVGAGILADKLPRWLDLMLVIFTATISLATGFVSMVSNADQLWFLCLLMGIGVVGVNIVGQRLIIVMWKERTASPTHALHMGFGIGAVLIPLIVNPFLMLTRSLNSNHTEPSLVGNTTTTSGPTNESVSDHSESQTVNSSTIVTFAHTYFSTNIGGVQEDFEIVQASNIQPVFILVGCVCLLSCFPFIIYQCLNSERCNPVFRKVVEMEVKKMEKIGFLQMLNPASYTAGSLGFALVMFTLLFIYFTGTVGGEQLFGTFIRTYSVDLLNFSKDNASYLLMIYWISFTMSRFLGSILTIFIHIKHLILVQAIFNLASVTAMTSMTKTKTNVWIFTIMQGVLYAPFFPMGISFANTVMDVRGFCLTIISLAGSLGDLGYIWVAGMLYDHVGPRGIMYTMQASGITIFIAVLGFRFASCGRKSADAKQYHTAPEKLEKLEMSVKGVKQSEETAGLLDSSDDEL